MSSIASIIDRVRGRRHQRAVESASTYLELVKTVALGEEVDADHAADVLELFNKSEEEFGKDCEQQARRYHDAEERSRLLAIQDTIPKLQSDYDRAAKAVDDAIAKLRPVAQEKARLLREAEHAASAVVTFENRLRETALDPAMIEREAVLNRQLREIHIKLRPLIDDKESVETHQRRYERELQAYGSHYAEASDLQVRSKYREKIDASRNNLNAVNDRLSKINSIIADIESELTPIKTELATIAKRKLQP